ncbi:diguanylate cyclase [Marinicella sp. W31]|uniref:diguanylate cyclase n=1 Tax=Marinicella sp. W31 TaxID=3023713 RepID=UPI0037570257
MWRRACANKKVSFWLLLFCTSWVQAIDLTGFESQLETITDAQAVFDFVESHAEDIESWPQNDQGMYYYRKGSALEGIGNTEAALASYTQAIKIFEQSTPPPEYLIHSLIERSYMKYVQTNDAEVYCGDRERALLIARQIEAQEALTRALIHMAFCYRTDRARFVEGLSLLEEALQAIEGHEQLKKYDGMIYNATGLMYRYNQIHDKAYEYLLKAHNAWAARNDIQDMFNMQHSLVGESVAMAKWEQAEQHVQQLFTLAESNPDFKDFHFFAYFNAGLVAYSRNNFNLAVKVLKQAESLYETTNEQYFVDRADEMLAIAYFRSGQIQDAIDKAADVLSNEAAEEGEQKPNLAMRAIADYGKGKYEQGLSHLWALVDSERDKRLEFIRYSSFAQAALFDQKLASYENAALEQALEINQLQLQAEQDKNSIFILTVVLVGLLAAGLIIWSVFLARSRKVYRTMAETDFLTGIASRRFTFEQGRSLVERALKNDKPVSVIIFDIDHFKQINDRYGHDVGDAAIVAIAQYSQRTLSDETLLGRIGGEEFLTILPDVKTDEALQIAEKLRKEIAALQVLSDHDSVRMTISAGIASSEKHMIDLEGLIQHADQALYTAKNQGRNQVLAA